MVWGVTQINIYKDCQTLRRHITGQSTTVVFVMVVIPVPVTNLQNQGKKLNNLLQ